MTSRERILAACSGHPHDHVPLTTWCFGFRAPDRLRWKTDGRDVEYWYSMRMEHLHTLPQSWTLEDDFRRAKAWLSIGVDDILDVSVPWTVDPEVTWIDSRMPADPGEGDPVLLREYRTPSGRLRHAVRQTREAMEPGWPVQPDRVPLFEDFNIPRAVHHAVSSRDDIDAVRFLYAPPDEEARASYSERMDRVQGSAEGAGVAVQAWPAFGMDAVVWLTGPQGAALMAMEDPEAFGRLLDVVAQTDLARTEMAAAHPGVDIIVQRGWYSSTDFWSPALFERWVLPSIRQMADIAHRHRKVFGYVMTTGVETLGPKLADAGVDVLYFVDPLQDGIAPQKARDLLTERMTVVGGISALTLQSAEPEGIGADVRRALDVLGPTNRFILHPVDSLFPDTPWAGVEEMIEAWEESR